MVHGYFGSTEGTFKQRYNGHKFNLEHKESIHTTLSAKYWQLVDENLNCVLTLRAASITKSRCQENYIQLLVDKGLVLTFNTEVLLVDGVESTLFQM